MRFLDAHGARTARLVRAKERLVKLLEEQKQAIIHRAVTRGLDPDIPLKSSGIPWLGDIPAHWEIRRIKSIAWVNPGKSELADVDSSTRVSFLPMERVGTAGEIDPIDGHSIAELAGSFTYFRKDDVIVAKITPCFENGKGALLDRLTTTVAFGSTEFIVLRARAGVRPRFLYLLTIEPQFRLRGADSMTGSAGQQRVSPAFVGTYRVAFPPLREQDDITCYIGEAASEIDRGISETRREIALLREFRARLVADVVTGKLDVRAAAAALPETGEEPAPIDEAEDLPEEAAEDDGEADLEEAAA